MSGLQRTCLVLLIIGGINWGLIGFFRFDLVSTISEAQDPLSLVLFMVLSDSVPCIA
ncbi:DUF378 domain-containing protein [Sporolactobacillus inulinus]|uniref:DUF378 domain-containing protein n=1 Tax=Sporolactobacillus inulinus TaxID=2078 RepID=A0A4Y1ZFB9_9BACL|nr:DUF378 domain-containing protein [Sporolactobacillus inulinus]